MSSEEWGLCRTCGVWIEGEWYSTDDIRAAVKADDVKLVLKEWKHGQPPVRWIPVAPIHGACGRRMRAGMLGQGRWVCRPCSFSVSMNADEIRAFERKTVLRPVPTEEAEEARRKRILAEPLVQWKCAKCGSYYTRDTTPYTCQRCKQQFCRNCSHDNEGVRLVGCPLNPKCRMEYYAKLQREKSPAEEFPPCAGCGRAMDLAGGVSYRCEKCGKTLCELCGRTRNVPYPSGKAGPVFASSGVEWQCYECQPAERDPRTAKEILDQLVEDINLLPQSDAVTKIISTDLYWLLDKVQTLEANQK